MNDAKKQAYLRIGIIIAILAISVFMSIWVKNIFLKIPFVILAVVVAVLLGRLYISYKRKKLYFDGKVLVINKPKRRIGRYSIIMQNGKISKKLFSYQMPKMKMGTHYVVVYEEKSFNILEFQEAKAQMMNTKAIKKNPKFKM